MNILDEFSVVGQLVRTSCQTGFNGSSGMQTWSKSPDILDDEEREFADLVSVFDVSSYPQGSTWRGMVLLNSGRVVVYQIKTLESDFAGRPGSYLAHGFFIHYRYFQYIARQGLSASFLLPADERYQSNIYRSSLSDVELKSHSIPNHLPSLTHNIFDHQIESYKEVQCKWLCDNKDFLNDYLIILIKYLKKIRTQPLFMPWNDHMSFWCLVSWLHRYEWYLDEPISVVSHPIHRSTGRYQIIGWDKSLRNDFNLTNVLALKLYETLPSSLVDNILAKEPFINDLVCKFDPIAFFYRWTDLNQKQFLCLQEWVKQSRNFEFSLDSLRLLNTVNELENNYTKLNDIQIIAHNEFLNLISETIKLHSKEFLRINDVNFSIFCLKFLSRNHEDITIIENYVDNLFLTDVEQSFATFYMRLNEVMDFVDPIIFYSVLCSLRSNVDFSENAFKIKFFVWADVYFLNLSVSTRKQIALPLAEFHDLFLHHNEIPAGDIVNAAFECIWKTDTTNDISLSFVILLHYFWIHKNVNHQIVFSDVNLKFTSYTIPEWLELQLSYDWLFCLLSDENKMSWLQILDHTFSQWCIRELTNNDIIFLVSNIFLNTFQTASKVYLLRLLLQNCEVSISFEYYCKLVNVFNENERTSLSHIYVRMANELWKFWREQKFSISQIASRIDLLLSGSGNCDILNQELYHFIELENSEFEVNHVIEENMMVNIILNTFLEEIQLRSGFYRMCSELLPSLSKKPLTKSAKLAAYKKWMQSQNTR